MQYCTFTLKKYITKLYYKKYSIIISLAFHYFCVHLRVLFIYNMYKKVIDEKLLC